MSKDRLKYTIPLQGYVYKSLRAATISEPAAASQNFGLPPIGPVNSMNPELQKIDIREIIGEIPPPDPLKEA